MCKIRKNFRFSEKVIAEIEQICKEEDMTLTAYIETLFRNDIAKRGRTIKKSKPKKYNSIDEMEV